MSPPASLACVVLLSSAFLVSAVVAIVPLSNTFKFVNTGTFGKFRNEYGASSRSIPLAKGPFQVCFYNTTPNTYTLALAMGTTRPDSVRAWVWEANRGRPVGENAVFSLLRDGNMVLTGANGRVVWQTNTANIGVVGFDLLANGNMVLYDAKRRYLWQSFDYPTDTLLAQQPLMFGRSKLVSRASTELNADGHYSLVVEPSGPIMYYQSPVDSKIYEYFSFITSSDPARQITLRADTNATDASGFIVFDIQTNSSVFSFSIFKPNYNPRYFYMRLQVDGNLRISIYDENVDSDAWQTPFSVFWRQSYFPSRRYFASECRLPTRCGSFGLCDEDGQCAACPTGIYPSLTGSLLGWNESCSTQAIKSCFPKDFYYYQLAGVDHFSVYSTPGDGPMALDACRAKCTNDCKCKGFFYQEDTQRCWAMADLSTLITYWDKGHSAFIKAPK